MKEKGGRRKGEEGKTRMKDAEGKKDGSPNVGVEACTPAMARLGAAAADAV